MVRNELEARLREQREARLDSIAPKAERDLYDTSFNALRSPARRRILVVATGLCIPVIGVSSMADWPVIALTALLCFMGLLILLRKVGRSIVDLPDELVDERMRAVRGQVYRWAYIGLMTAIPILFVTDIAFTIAEKNRLSGLARLSPDQWWDGVMSVFFLGMALPSMIHVWIEPEL